VSRPREKAPGEPDPLSDLIGCFEGPGDLSDRHDDYLYSGPEEGSDLA
jgi:hypothetical protein